MEDLTPWLYLKRTSTGDFSEALSSLVGPDAPGLSASTVVRLKTVWETEDQEWNRRSFESKR
jgi:putative transposase